MRFSCDAFMQKNPPSTGGFQCKNLDYSVMEAVALFDGGDLSEG